MSSRDQDPLVKCSRCIRTLTTSNILLWKMTSFEKLHRKKIVRADKLEVISDKLIYSTWSLSWIQTSKAHQYFHDSVINRPSIITALAHNQGKGKNKHVHKSNHSRFSKVFLAPVIGQTIFSYVSPKFIIISIKQINSRKQKDGGKSQLQFYSKCKRLVVAKDSEAEVVGGWGGSGEWLLMGHSPLGSLLGWWK